MMANQAKVRDEGREPVRPDARLLAEVEAGPRSGQPVPPVPQVHPGLPAPAAMDVHAQPGGADGRSWGCGTRCCARTPIWICASCQTCTTRCPNGIDIAQLMDTLRQIGKTAAGAPAEPTRQVFHERSCDPLRATGGSSSWA